MAKNNDKVIVTMTVHSDHVRMTSNHSSFDIAFDTKEAFFKVLGEMMQKNPHKTFQLKTVNQ